MPLVLIELLGVSELVFIWARLTRPVNHARLPIRPPAERQSAPTGRRWVLAVLPLIALSVILAACGGSSSSTASPTTSTSPSTATSPSTSGGAGTARAGGSAAFAKYTQCLTSHGVPASATGFGGRRRPGTATTPGATTVPATRPTIPAQYQAAFKSCASLLPRGGGGFFGGGQANSAQAAAYRNCLTIHGVTLPSTPSTTPGQTRPAGGFGGGQFANNPTFQAAQKACASLLPARTGATTTTPVAAGA
jgi:hypothetical protein